MDNSQLLNEIRETNLTYLLLAQRMIKDDKAAALFRLGIAKDAAELIEALTPAQVRAAAATIDPKALTWVVVGDLKQIEAPVRALKLGEVRVLDADGNAVAGSD